MNGTRSARARADLFFAGALAFGLFFPSSIGGNTLVSLQVLQLAPLVVLLMVVAPPRVSGSGRLRLWISLMIPTILLGATFVGLSAKLAIGGLMPFVAAAAVFASDLTGLQPSRRAIQILAVANLVLVGLGVLVVLGRSSAADILQGWYAMAYEELLPNMIARRKPVGTFGSHSTAGFAYYLLLHLWISTYEARGKLRYLLLAIANLALGAALGSVTALAFTAVGVVRLGLVAFRSPRAALVLGTALVAVIAGLAVFPYLPQLEVLARAALWSDLNGFLGRYGSSGTLLGTLAYIGNHPFRPLGVGHRLDVFYGDSGPIEYVLRGSVPLLLSMYAGLYLFLRHNLKSRRQLWHLLLPILAFEFGYTSLTYPRLLYLLPLAVVYLNSLQEQAPFRQAATVPALVPAPSGGTL